MKTINDITLEDAYQAALKYLEFISNNDFDFGEYGYKTDLSYVYLFLSKHEIFKDIRYDKKDSSEDICRMITYLYSLTQEW